MKDLLDHLVSRRNEMNYTVCAVVVTYNRLLLLKECLKCISSQLRSIDRLIIINNNSSDGTKKYLNCYKNNSRVHVINLDRNIGGAGGFSLGIQHAFEDTTCDYFWVMDDDTIPTKTALSELISVIKKLHGNVGFLSSNIRWIDKSPAIMNIPEPDKKWNERLKDRIIKIKSASFVSLLINRNSVKKIGLPISEFFIWGDDMEYTSRISQKYNCYLVDESIVIHKTVTNSEVNIIKETNLSRIPRYFFDIRNKGYIAKKRGIIHFWKYIISSIFLILNILFNSKIYKIKKIIYIIRGVIASFIFNPKVKFPNG